MGRGEIIIPSMLERISPRTDRKVARDLCQ